MPTAARQTAATTSPRITDLFQVFINERQMLKNVSPKTIAAYGCSYNAFRLWIEPMTTDGDIRAAMKAGIQSLASRLNPVSVNDYVRTWNAFFHWAHVEGYMKERLKIGKLKEPEPLPKVLPEQDIDKLLAYKPTAHQERAAHLLALMILDAGGRIDELLHLRKDQIDFNDLVLFISKGKGGKQRQVPFSDILKSAMVKYVNHRTVTQPGYDKNPFLFTTKSGKLLSYRNALRGLHQMAEKARIPILRFHQLRHSMATAYLRNGGNVTHLRRILGHRSLNTTMRYEHLNTVDLSAAHLDHSLLVLRQRKRG